MRVQFLYDLVVIHAYFSELGVESGQPRGEFHRPPVGSYDPKLVAEDPCFDESGLRERARLLEQREEPGIFPVVKRTITVSIRFTTYFLEVFENIWDKIWRN